MEWVTPTGHLRITHPIDHLEPARPPAAPDRIGNGNDKQGGLSRFGDPLLPPTQPAQLVPELPPKPRPSTGSHADGDFGWLHHLYTSTAAMPGRGLHPITITHAELDRCAARRRVTDAAKVAERLAAQRAAERAARDAQPPPF